MPFIFLESTKIIVSIDKQIAQHSILLQKAIIAFTDKNYAKAA